MRCPPEASPAGGLKAMIDTGDSSSKNLLEVLATRMATTHRNGYQPSNPSIRTIIFLPRDKLVAVS
jgi:hypothetical protein